MRNSHSDHSEMREEVRREVESFIEAFGEAIDDRPKVTYLLL